MMTAQTFQVGDVVVHPHYGVCRIQALERVQLRERNEVCYVFRLGSPRNPLKVLLPTTQAASVGLHRLISRRTAKQFLCRLAKPGSSMAMVHACSLDECTATVQQGTLADVLAVAQRLAALGIHEEATPRTGGFMSRRWNTEALLTQALERLSAELAFALGVPQERMAQRIRRSLNKHQRAAAQAR